MAPERYGVQLSWSEVLDRHIFVLTEHLQLWKQLKSQLPKPSDKRKAVGDCIDKTKDMIKSLQEFTITLNTGELPSNFLGPHGMSDNTGKPKAAPPKPRKPGFQLPKARNPFSQIPPEPFNSTDYVAPVTDASGLFAIDTNPTPVNGGKSEKKNKRKSRGMEDQEDIAETPAAKRHKSGDEQSEQDDDASSEDSFDERVEQRLKEKEEQRLKIYEKKRKRELDPLPPNSELAQFLEPDPGARKRRKQDLRAQLAKAQETDPTITYKEIKCLNLRKNWRRLQSQGISSIIEGIHLQREHNKKQEKLIELRKKRELKKKRMRINKRVRKGQKIEEVKKGERAHTLRY